MTGAYLSATTSSFTEFAAHAAPEVLPRNVTTQVAPHATTIVSAVFGGGVVMAGDRRATLGSMIAQRDIEKVFGADDYSVIGVAGIAGLAIEMVRLFQVELEHFEKIEGAPLSLDGKANRLAAMIRGNLGLALQGLVVVPMFAGWDVDQARGRVFSYDGTGGRYEESGYYAVGSGAPFARSSLKKLYRPELDETAAAQALVQALFDAADDDAATGGPDAARNIFPVLFAVTADGVRRYSTDEVAALSAQVVIA